jgi:uncharacterized repeat protein (TIGR02543 family)
MRTALLAAVILLVFGVLATAQPAPYVNVTDYGASPTASAATNTAAIQSAVDYARTIGAIAYIPNGSYMVDAVTSIILDDNATLEMHENAVLATQPNSIGYDSGSGQYQVLKIIGSNVTVRGGSIQGDRDGHTYPIVGNTYEFGHGIALNPTKSISNIVIDDVYIYDCVGDGIVATGGISAGYKSFDVVISNCVIEDCRRQGISIVVADDVTIRDCTITGIGVTKYGKAGTAPMFGIDIEGGGSPRGCVIDDCNFSDNEGGSVCLYNSNDTTVTDNNCVGDGMVFQWSSNCTISGNTLTGAGIVQDIDFPSDMHSGYHLAVGYRYIIVAQSTLDFTTVGAADNNPGTEFVATSQGPLGAGDSARRVCENITISNNTITGSSIQSAGWTRNVVISNNTVTDSPTRGIFVGSFGYDSRYCGGEVVTGNHLSNQVIGIRCDGLGAVVRNNTISTASNRGIYAAGGATDGLIEGNTLTNCGGVLNSSIDIGSGAWEIKNNTISVTGATTPAYGIWVRPAGSSIVRNTLTGTMGSCIQVRAEPNEISENSLTGATATYPILYYTPNATELSLMSLGTIAVATGELCQFSVRVTGGTGTLVCSAEGLPEGATFVGQRLTWTPTAEQAGSYEITITVNDDVTEVSRTITIEVHSRYSLDTITEHGQVTVTPDRDYYTSIDTAVSLQAVPDTGYTFSGWSGDASGTTNPTTITMNANKSVTANFTAAPVTYALSVSATNGTVTKTPDQTGYASGQSVTLQATPNAGYAFSSWSGDASGTTNPSTVTMNGSKSVTANFTAVPVTYALSVSATNGTVTKTPNQTSYTSGQTVTLQATPNTGYTFSGWSGDASGTTNPTTVTMNANKSVTASFTAAPVTYALNVSATNGTVAKTPNQASYTSGQSVTLQATPTTGYTFSGWSGDASGTTNPTTVTMNANKSVTAIFTQVAPDQEAPVLFGFSPLADAIQVPLNSLVLLRITDSGEGVDGNTVSVEVNENNVYSGNVDSCSGSFGVCRRIGTPAYYVYAYQPANDFDYDSTVTVTVNAADQAGNAMAEQSYSFRTQMRTFGSNRCASWGPDGLDKGGAATARDGSGTIWAVWHAGEAGARDIYLSRLMSGVEQFSGLVQLTTDTADQCNPDIAAGADGKLYVVWQSNQRGNWDIFASTSVDGAAWSTAVQVTDFDNDEINPVIAVDARSPSYAYVAWQDNRAGNQDIYVATSSTGFVSKAVACVASNAQDQIGPRIAVDGSNAVYLVWADFRNGTADVYGAASNSGPWTNVAIAAGAGSQSAPDIAAEPTSSVLHFAWMSDPASDDDIFYGTSVGLPASPLAGTNLIDDSSAADQRTPAIIATGAGGGTPRIFVAWQDFRNAADGWDTDLYVVEVKAGSETNLFVGDAWTRTNQSEPCIGVDLFGRPYVVWTDDRNANDEIYFAASTFVEPTPLDTQAIIATSGETLGAASPAQLDDVSVVIPAGACPYDVTVSIARIHNLPPGASAYILPYEFGPSGLQFDVPVTITIPYATADYPSNPPQPCWYDAMTGAMSQQGITNIQQVALSSTIHALRFQTTHFTPYAVVAGADDTANLPSGGGGGGGCSLSPVTGTVGALEYFVPFAMLAIAMISIRRRDRRRCSNLDSGSKGD